MKNKMRERIEYYLNDELKAAREYHSLGLHSFARDEEKHARYWERELRKVR